MKQQRTDWRLIALLYVVGLLASGQFAKIALTLESLAVIYPEQSVTILVSAVSVAGALFGATAGLAVGRFGPSRVLLLALLGAGLLTVLQGMLLPYPVMLSLRVLEGFAHLGIVVAAPTLMATASRRHDVSIAMGLWGTFFGVGFALSAAVIPLASGPSIVLFAHATALFAMAGLLWPLLPRIGSTEEQNVGFIKRHVAIYGTPRIVAPSIGFFAHTLLFMGLLTFLPRILGTWTGPLLPLVALVGTFGAGVLTRFMAPRNVVMLGFGLSVLGFGVAVTLDDQSRLWLVLALMVVVGLVPGAAFASVPQLNESVADRAGANGAIAQLGNVGTACSVPLFAFALGAEFAGIALITIVISVLGLVAAWLIHKNIA